ncbi:MAG: DUF4149 domain-containing protein [Dehalococcoidia bacterium]|nr:DUF4149 domain-containing protein [Dehalococcoidia bacterium]
MDTIAFAVNQFAYTLALIAWVGCSFMTLLAGPVIFKVSASRKAARDFNGLLLSNLNRLKYSCLIVVSLTLIIRYVQWNDADTHAIARFGLLVAMGGAAIFSELVVSPLTRRVRARMGSGETSGAFRRLHGSAMLLFLAEILAGIAIWFFN